MMISLKFFLESMRIIVLIIKTSRDLKFIKAR